MPRHAASQSSPVFPFSVRGEPFRELLAIWKRHWLTKQVSYSLTEDQINQCQVLHSALEIADFFKHAPQQNSNDQRAAGLQLAISSTRISVFSHSSKGTVESFSLAGKETYWQVDSTTNPTSLRHEKYQVNYPAHIYTASFKTPLEFNLEYPPLSFLDASRNIPLDFSSGKLFSNRRISFLQRHETEVYSYPSVPSSLFPTARVSTSREEVPIQVSLSGYVFLSSFPNEIFFGVHNLKRGVWVSIADLIEELRNHLEDLDFSSFTRAFLQSIQKIGENTVSFPTSLILERQELLQVSWSCSLTRKQEVAHFLEQDKDFSEKMAHLLKVFQDYYNSFTFDYPMLPIRPTQPTRLDQMPFCFSRSEPVSDKHEPFFYTLADIIMHSGRVHISDGSIMEKSRVGKALAQAWANPAKQSSSRFSWVFLFHNISQLSLNSPQDYCDFLKTQYHQFFPLLNEEEYWILTWITFLFPPNDCLFIVDNTENGDLLNPDSSPAPFVMPSHIILINSSLPVTTSENELVVSNGPLSESLMKTFLTNFLSAFLVNPQFLLRSLNTDPTILEFASNPKNLEWICSMAVIATGKPGVFTERVSISSLYQHLLITLCEHLLKKKSDKTASGDERAVLWGARSSLEFLSYCAYFSKTRLTETSSVQKVINYFPEAAKSAPRLFNRFEFLTLVALELEEDGNSFNFRFLDPKMQDFFVAYYLAGCFAGRSRESDSLSSLPHFVWQGSLSLEEFIRQHKFDSTYKNVFPFIFHHLAENDQLPSLLELINFIITEPRDITGFYDSILLLRCLNEAGEYLERKRPILWGSFLKPIFLWICFLWTKKASVGSEYNNSLWDTLIKCQVILNSSRFKKTFADGPQGILDTYFATQISNFDLERGKVFCQLLYDSDARQKLIKPPKNLTSSPSVEQVAHLLTHWEKIPLDTKNRIVGALKRTALNNPGSVYIYKNTFFFQGTSIPITPDQAAEFIQRMDQFMGMPLPKPLAPNKSSRMPTPSIDSIELAPSPSSACITPYSSSSRLSSPLATTPENAASPPERSEHFTTPFPSAPSRSLSSVETQATASEVNLSLLNDARKESPPPTISLKSFIPKTALNDPETSGNHDQTASWLLGGYWQGSSVQRTFSSFVQAIHSSIASIGNYFDSWSSSEDPFSPAETLSAGEDTFFRIDQCPSENDKNADITGEEVIPSPPPPPSLAFT